MACAAQTFGESAGAALVVFALIGGFALFMLAIGHVLK